MLLPFLAIFLSVFFQKVGYTFELNVCILFTEAVPFTLPDF